MASPGGHFADRGKGTKARGAFRPPGFPAAAQKFAGCFQVNFEGAEVFAFLLEKRPPRFPGSSLVGFALSSETRGTILSGRLVEVKKKLTLEGAVRGFWGGGKPGRGALVGRRLDREFGGRRGACRGGRRGRGARNSRNWPSRAAPQLRRAELARPRARSCANRRGPQEALLGPGLGARWRWALGRVRRLEPAVSADRALSWECWRSRGITR